MHRTPLQHKRQHGEVLSRLASGKLNPVDQQAPAACWWQVSSTTCHQHGICDMLLQQHSFNRLHVAARQSAMQVYLPVDVQTCTAQVP